MKSNLVLLCVQGFDVLLVIQMFETILMWLEIYYQVVWGRFGMVLHGFVDIWKVLDIQSRL